MRDCASEETAWKTREPSSTADRPPFCSAWGSPPLADAPFALWLVVCVSFAAIPLPRGLPGDGELTPARLSGARSRAGRRAAPSLCGSPAGRSRSSSLTPGSRSWRPTVSIAVSITRLRLRVAIRLAPITAWSSSVGWTSTTSAPAARSTFASLPSRRPDVRRKRWATRCAGFHACGGWSDEVGLRQMTRSGGDSRRMSRFEVDHTPPST